ncbi:MAG: hypothetical protein CMP66_04575 [Flavobacteriales bacterium]|nr:hypothetical protein [Flavobacteriales bacterium]|tara:strand:+ start:95 stop:670 length:576 start_codon:yes stop_codon:yes gene_type:complete
MRIFKIMTLFALSTLLVVGCKSKEEVGVSPKQQGEVLLEQYCSGKDFFSDKKTFRASAIGESLDQMTSKKKARSNAQSELAKTMKSTMQIVGDNYVSSTEFNNKEEVTESFNEMARTIVNEELRGAIKICEKFTQTSEGKYKCYMAIELSADKLVAKYHERLSKDEKVKAQYNYEQFKKTFEEAMEQIANQ